MADDELKELQDLFDGNDPDDMESFMNMLDSVELDENKLGKELEDTNLSNMDEEKPAVQPATEEEPPQELPVMEKEKPVDVPVAEEADTAFVPPEDDDIMNILDAVGEPALGDDEDADEVADESVGELADILAGLDEEMGEEEEQEAVKAEPKKGLIRRIIERFHKEPTPEELQMKEQEEAEEREWEEKQQAKVDEKKKLKAEAAEKKKKENEEKKSAKDAQKAAKAEKKAAEKAEKESKKEQKRDVPRSQLVPVKPMIVLIILGIACSVAFVLFTNNRFYNASVRESREEFIHQKYKEAYESLFGLEIKKKDEKFYNQVKTVRMVDKDLDAYNNYIQVKNYESALESLIKGVGKYGLQAEKAKELSLEKEMHKLYEEMVKELTVRFDLTAQDAVNLYNATDKEQYKKEITQIARDAAIRDGVLEPVEITQQ